MSTLIVVKYLASCKWWRNHRLGHSSSGCSIFKMPSVPLFLLLKLLRHKHVKYMQKCTLSCVERGKIHNSHWMAQIPFKSLSHEMQHFLLQIPSEGLQPCHEINTSITLLFGANQEPVSWRANAISHLGCLVKRSTAYIIQECHQLSVNKPH